MFTWRTSFSTEKSIQDSDYFKAISNLLCEDNLAKFRRNGITPVLSIHHHLINKFKFHTHFSDNIIIAEPTQISSFIRKSYVCVTDFSSVSFDFKFLNKPVIYWIPDLGSKMLDKHDSDKQMVCIQHLEPFNDMVYDID